MDGSVVVARWCQCALSCGHTGATWQIRLHLCFHVRPTQVHNPNGKLICSTIFAQLTAEYRLVDWRHLANMTELVSFGSPESTTQTANPSVQPLLCSWQQKVPILNNGIPFPPKLPILMGGSGPPSNSWFLGPVQAHNPNGITIGSAVFAQVTAECPYSLQWDAPFPLNIAPFHLIHGSLFPPKSSTQTASRLVQPLLQGSLMWQTGRQTDHVTPSVTTDRICVCSTGDAV